MAFRILAHAFRMVFGNFGAALRISMPMIVLAIAGMFVAFSNKGAGTSAPDEPVFNAVFVIWLVAYLVSTLWVAVAWHRYCLREEYPGSMMPAFHGDRMLGYLGWSLVIMVAAILVSIAAGIVIGGVAALSQSTALAAILWLCWFAVLLWLIQRISLVLPATALRESVSLRQSWEATRPLSGTIFAVALIFAVLSFLLAQAALPFVAVSPVLAGAVSVAAQWISTMLGLSVLTTIYGICIEGRAVE